MAEDGRSGGWAGRGIVWRRGHSCGCTRGRGQTNGVNPSGETVLDRDNPIVLVLVGGGDRGAGKGGGSLLPRIVNVANPASDHGQMPCSNSIGVRYPRAECKRAAL